MNHTNFTQVNVFALTLPPLAPSSGEIFNLKFDLPIPFGMGAAGADTTGGLAKAIGLGGGGGNPLPE